jgi:hypothetical protein
MLKITNLHLGNKENLVVFYSLNFTLFFESELILMEIETDMHDIEMKIEKIEPEFV